MITAKRIDFFRSALTICARYGRSPQAAITVRGRAVPLRQVLKTLHAGERLPIITEAEARTLARETKLFSYDEILTGLSARRPAARRGQGRERRGRAARARRSR